jgi:predicted AAA+ superfamily ATPase
MHDEKRYLINQVELDLARKMVFVGGPRQVGKTTMAKHLLGLQQQGYLSWDIPSGREAILTRELPSTDIWVFDELHKYKQWRDYLKGVFDQFGIKKKILVTGSARLDYYRRGGDSLQGRYHYLRLNPLSVAELKITQQADLLQLFKLGGFPEPYFTGTEIEAKRWSQEYRQRLIQEDLLSLEHVKDLGTLELLMLRLPDLVSSPLSINSLCGDLQVSHKTLTHWLDIFERLYAIFRLPPFGAPRLRAIKKAQKHYHYDWTLVDKEGCRFENMVAMHLLKWVQYENDVKARELALCYFRDVDGREVDFIITEKSKPILAVECKLSDGDIDKGLKYFKKHFPDCEAYQISLKGSKDYISAQNIRVCHAIQLLSDFV